MMWSWHGVGCVLDEVVLGALLSLRGLCFVSTLLFGRVEMLVMIR